ncbi:MAG: hypothetical protein PSV36_04485 [Algoriphagus sp.]|nr:hypothetical protein [Algoriphagus sp.]
MDKKIDELESKISFYLPIAWGFVAGAIVPLFYAGFVVFAQNKYWQEADLGSFIGGVSGTLAALSGVFFVYVAFLGQRISILQQQIELRDNRKELRETRMEIQGQKEQLELQNLIFKQTQIKDTFFRLFESYRQVRENVTYNNFIEWDKRISNLPPDMKWSKSNGIVMEKCLGEEAFKNIYFNLKDWAKEKWKPKSPEKFEELSGYKYVTKPEGFTFDSCTKEEIKFLIRAIIDEESIGSYFRMIDYVLRYIIVEGMIKELELLEAQMGKSERILTFYWLYSQQEESRMEIFQEYKFLYSVSEKHLLSRNHKNLLLR